MKPKFIFYKINNRKGETVPEALVAVGVIAISLCMLALTLTMAMNVSKTSNDTFNTFYEEEGLVASSIYGKPEEDSGISSSSVTVTMELYESGEHIIQMDKSLTMVENISDTTELFTITKY